MRCQAVCKNGNQCNNGATFGGMCLTHYKLYQLGGLTDKKHERQRRWREKQIR